MWCLTLSGCHQSCSDIPLLSWAGERKCNKKSREGQGELTEQLPSQGRQRDPKISTGKLNTEENCTENCTWWWLKYCCGLSVGKSSGALIIAFPSELHPSEFALCELCPGCDGEKGGERNQMLWKTKVVWSGAVANSSCNNRAVAFQILISQKNLYQILQPRGQEGF